MTCDPFRYTKFDFSFNPCYDGFVILTDGDRVGFYGVTRFNPCYDGFVILTIHTPRDVGEAGPVSILVMMDLSF